MKKKDKAKSVIRSRSELFILVLLLFAVATFLLLDAVSLAVAEAVVAILLYVIDMTLTRKKNKEIVEYIETVTYGAEETKNNTLVNFPLPIVSYFLDSKKVVWGNQIFFGICGFKEASYGVDIQTLVPEYDGKWLMNGKTRCPNLIHLNGRLYQVHGNMIRGKAGQASTGSLGITYWVDVTDYEDIKREHEQSRPVVMLIEIDNFDELTKTINERQKMEMRNAVEDILGRWIEGGNGILRRYDRARYLYICERKQLDKLQKADFKVCSMVREVQNASGISATVSIGVGFDGAGYEDNFNNASMSLDMALSRGGDQAVTKNRINFNFFGGRGDEVETRSKVRSRVVAGALVSFIKDSSVTYVMGHKYADMDTLGAAVGISAIARVYGKKCKIIMDPKENACSQFLAEIRTHKEYEDILCTAKEAMLQANSRSLLVVVDTNRPDSVEDEALLNTISRVVLIDHHRRSGNFIDNAAVSFLEPSASSACELVTELLQEILQPKDIFPFEAEALLAGMEMDTKNFTIRTGERSFDAAAFLKRLGADIASVKRLLQTDFNGTIERYSIMQNAYMYREKIALAPYEKTVDRVAAAKAADDLLGISGVECSIVLFPTEEGGVMVSARSIGEINVQVLLEKIGGGGNKSAAGAQLKNTELDDVVEQLHQSIDDYLS